MSSYNSMNFNFRRLDSINVDNNSYKSNVFSPINPRGNEYKSHNGRLKGSYDKPLGSFRDHPRQDYPMNLRLRSHISKINDLHSPKVQNSFDLKAMSLNNKISPFKLHKSPLAQNNYRDNSPFSTVLPNLSPSNSFQIPSQTNNKFNIPELKSKLNMLELK